MFNSYREDVTTALKAISPERVKEVVDILRRAQSQNANVYILGNGGSAATASHFANDLLRCGIRSVALTDLTPTILAYGNDFGWDEMFAGPLRQFLFPQDVVIFISCSGNSQNIVSSMRMVKDINIPLLKTIVLTGSDMNCQLVQYIPTVIVFVPFRDIRVQEDCHMVICHAVIGELCNAAAKAD